MVQSASFASATSPSTQADWNMNARRSQQQGPFGDLVVAELIGPGFVLQCAILRPMESLPSAPVSRPSFGVLIIQSLRLGRVQHQF